MMGKAQPHTPPRPPMWGPFPKCEVRLGYHLVVGPLFWGIPPHLGYKPSSQGASYSIVQSVSSHQ